MKNKKRQEGLSALKVEDSPNAFRAYGRKAYFSEIESVLECLKTLIHIYTYANGHVQL